MSAADTSKYGTAAVTVAPATNSTLSLWPTTAIPAVITDSDPNAVELGVKFRSDVATHVVGIRFYKGPYNKGTHVGHLWSSSGQLLGSVTFANETAPGWQTAMFASPIAINANTTYVISYYAPFGHYSSNDYYFTSGVNNVTLHAPANSSSVPNGVYKYGSSGLPNQSYAASNYWVDVLVR